MQDFFAMFALTLGVFVVSFAMINIRHIFTGNEFRGTCAQVNAKLKNEIGEVGRKFRRQVEKLHDSLVFLSS